VSRDRCASSFRASVTLDVDRSRECEIAVAEGAIFRTSPLDQPSYLNSKVIGLIEVATVERSEPVMKEADADFV
jgi:hypothetical protein